jgi:transposase
MAFHLRAPSEGEIGTLRRLAHARAAPARAVQRARGGWLASQGHRVPAIARERHLTPAAVRRWLKRFHRQGLPGVEAQPRSGRPALYSPGQVGEAIATALAAPKPLSLPFACWTLDRLQAYLHEVEGLWRQRTRIDERLLAGGVRWRQQETWVGGRVGPAGAETRGSSRRSTRRRRPPVS